MRLLNRNRFLLLILIGLCACRQPYYMQRHGSKTYAVEHGAADSNMLAMLAPYKLGVDTQMQVVIGFTDIPLTKAQPECLLGNFLADAVLKAAQKLDAKVVAAVMNYGSIRLPYVAPGALTLGRFYEIMPFDDKLTIIEMAGADIRTLCNHMAVYKGWPVSGLRYTIKDKQAVDIALNGSPLNDNIYYKIAVGEYVAKGGDNCDFLQPLHKRFTSIFIRDAMIEYVAELAGQNKPLHPQIANRVQYAE
jgi:2',3'-cyclic-nucleotide 2'-phosphodiesterase (5'-nucleotidase family)